MVESRRDSIHQRGFSRMRVRVSPCFSTLCHMRTDRGDDVSLGAIIYRPLGRSAAYGTTTIGKSSPVDLPASKELDRAWFTPPVGYRLDIAEEMLATARESRLGVSVESHVAFAFLLSADLKKNLPVDRDTMSPTHMFKLVQLGVFVSESWLVRDSVIGETSQENAHADMQLWSRVCTVLPQTYAATSYAMVAFRAWQTGNRPLHELAVMKGLDVAPNHELLGLLDRAYQEHLPAAWAEQLRRDRVGPVPHPYHKHMERLTGRIDAAWAKTELLFSKPTSQPRPHSASSTQPPKPQL